ncbi:cardiolipin synthase [Flavobacterium antarcticum]|uniref:cardiolipin synthase n=1 Tax=Flavobacterium antarcticum TaxID=271155 RepID=UPI0003B5CAFB|nr:cardiolipin synthase [Flavobacterium antarcticum]
MTWLILIQILYGLLVFLVIAKVLYDTRSGTKALAYILFIVLVPVVGMVFYFSFGINYRKKVLYDRKMVDDEVLLQKIINKVRNYSQEVADSHLMNKQYRGLAKLIYNVGNSPLTANNKVELLRNGEEKFPKVLEALRNAKSSIHLEYYIYENDTTGNQIVDVLIEKAKEGIEVRFMYDDFGSHGLKNNIIKRLTENGVQTAPFYKIKLYAFANRINYRNHRKIIVIDGLTSFVGGINISDKYRNDLDNGNKLFWRDTHLMLQGPATFYLQYTFLCDWNYCSNQKLIFDPKYFPTPENQQEIEGEIVQIVSSGPDSDLPLIYYSLIDALASAKKQICITSPYFIPSESLVDALIMACEKGIKVKILVPGISDSKMVNAAARAYYTEILQHGAQIYLYNKGFVHAKTMVVDEDLAIIGSANMDYRSFDLNFEVNAMVYSSKIARQLLVAFEDDLSFSAKIDAKAWLARPKRFHLWEKLVRLLSPFL